MYVIDYMLDTALAQTLISKVVTLCLCSQAPTTYAEATSTYMLASRSIASGDWTYGEDGSPDGRKARIGPLVLTASDDGTVTHWAMCGGTALWIVGECVSQAVEDADTITLSTITVTMRDPTVPA